MQGISIRNGPGGRERGEGWPLASGGAGLLEELLVRVCKLLVGSANRLGRGGTLRRWVEAHLLPLGLHFSLSADARLHRSLGDRRSVIYERETIKAGACGWPAAVPRPMRACVLAKSMPGAGWRAQEPEQPEQPEEPRRGRIDAATQQRAGSSAEEAKAAGRKNGGGGGGGGNGKQKESAGCARSDMLSLLRVGVMLRRMMR